MHDRSWSGAMYKLEQQVTTHHLTCWSSSSSLLLMGFLFWLEIADILHTWVTLCYETAPIFLFFYFTFIDSFLVMWLSCDHIVTHYTCDGYCSIPSIVLWPIVQGDSIVPVMAIVLVTLLFSFTISTSSLWPYSLRLDFCILWYRQAIRVLSPLSSPCPSCLKVIHSKASDCLSS